MGATDATAAGSSDAPAGRRLPIKTHVIGDAADGAPAAAATPKTPPKKRKPFGFLACGLRALGKQLEGCCATSPEEDCGHARLQRMVEEHERELAAAKQLAEERKVAEETAEETAQMEWQAELREIQERRLSMSDKELEQDCFAHLASAELFQQSPPADGSPSDADVAACQDADGQEVLDRSVAGEEASEVLPPEGPFERWLAQCLGAAHEDVADDGAAQVERSPSAASATERPSAWKACLRRSFGELPSRSVAGLVGSLVEVLSSEAAEAESRAMQLAGIAAKAETRGFSERFDEILARFAEDEQNEAGIVSDAKQPAGDAEAAASAEQRHAEAAAMRARAARCRSVGARIQALAPCLEADIASARLVVALATADLADLTDIPIGSVEPDGNGNAVLVNRSCGCRDFRGFREPLCAMSTADVCWALCSEKRRLVIERMVPSVMADGRWLWPQLRRTGICWWLCGGGVKGTTTPPAELELLDLVATKLAQSALAHLRHFEKTGALFKTAEKTAARQSAVEKAGDVMCDSREMRRLTDEAVFWYAVMGTQLAKLKVLVKTGMLHSEPGLKLLLEHHRSSEPQFIRRNAFRLLSLHRYHLAAALFALIGNYEEAARVVVSHLRDLQLLLLLARRHPEIITLLLPDSVSHLSSVEDPWLHVLLAWHLGDERSARRHAAAPATEPQHTQEEAKEQARCEDPTFFDGVLRLSGPSCEPSDVAQVVRAMFGPRGERSAAQ